jgi:hypothetical protein
MEGQAHLESAHLLAQAVVVVVQVALLDQQAPMLMLVLAVLVAQGHLTQLLAHQLHTLAVEAEAVLLFCQPKEVLAVQAVVLMVETEICNLVLLHKIQVAGVVDVELAVAFLVAQVHQAL